MPRPLLLVLSLGFLLFAAASPDPFPSPASDEIVRVHLYELHRAENGTCTSNVGNEITLAWGDFIKVKTTGVDIDLAILKERNHPTLNKSVLADPRVQTKQERGQAPKLFKLRNRDPNQGRPSQRLRLADWHTLSTPCTTYNGNPVGGLPEHPGPSAGEHRLVTPPPVMVID